MEQQKYSVETVYQIWNDKTGERIELGPDRDGLDLFEIRQITDDGQTTNRITLTAAELANLYDAIVRALRERRDT